jgi:hypothetical protein
VTVGMLLALGPTRDQPFSVVPKPAPCLVGRITEWAECFRQKWCAAFPSPRGDGGGEMPPMPPAPSQLPPEPADRLSLLELASHNRLWRALPHGCEEQWLDSIRSDFMALRMFHSESDWNLRGRALDSILRHPGRTLVRKRGGRRRTEQAVRARLKTVTAAAIDPARLAPPLPLRPLPPEKCFTEDDAWAAKLRRASAFYAQGLPRKGARTITSLPAPPFSASTIPTLQALHPSACDDPLTPLPVDPPPSSS